MRHHVLAVIASMLAACTSVSRVVVTPDQLHGLVGLGPDEERAFVPLDQTQKLIARGDDEVRLQLRPGRPVSVAETPWVQLCQLQWEPPYGFGPTGPTGTLSDGVVRVPAADVTGAELQVTHPDALKTTALVLGILLATTVAVLIGGAAFLNAVNSQQPPLTAR